MKYIITSEGRLIPDGNSFKSEYFLTDHLGNTRVLFGKNAQGQVEIKQENHYYAYGMEIADQSFSNTAKPNKFLYNGKEYDQNTGYYQYGFRQYDAQIGRWHVVDAMSENYYSTSPYMYVMGNPVGLLDVLGLSAAAGYSTSDPTEIMQILNYAINGGNINYLVNAIGNAEANGTGGSFNGEVLFAESQEFFYYSMEVGYFSDLGVDQSYNGATSFFYIKKNAINLPSSFAKDYAYRFDSKTTWEDLIYSKYNSDLNKYMFTSKQNQEGADIIMGSALALVGGAAAFEFAGYQIASGLSKLVQLAPLKPLPMVSSFVADATAQMTLAEGTLKERFLNWNIMGSAASAAFKLPVGQAFWGSALEITPENINNNTLFRSTIFGNKTILNLGIQTGIGGFFNYTGGQSLISTELSRNAINNVMVSPWLHAPYLYPNYILGSYFSNSLIQASNK